MNQEQSTRNGSHTSLLQRLAIGLITVTLASTGLAEVALADSEGIPGSVVGVMLIDDDSDIYASRHGEVLIRQIDGEEQAYVWGGFTCQDKTIPSEVREALIEAAGNRKKLVYPFYGGGLGGQRCIRRFWIHSKKGLNSPSIP